MCFFFLNDTATTEIYTLSLHDALPISVARAGPGDQFVASAGDPVGHRLGLPRWGEQVLLTHDDEGGGDRKSTRLNSSHANISYAVFCLEKKNTLSLTGILIQYHSALHL